MMTRNVSCYNVTIFILYLSIYPHFRTIYFLTLSHQVSELDGEAAVWVVLDVHDFSVVGQDEKLTTSEVREEDKTQTPRGFVDF